MHGLRATALERRRDDGLEVVHVVDEAPVDGRERGVHVPRHREIDEEHGAAAPRAQRGHEPSTGENEPRRARGGDDDVGFRQRLRDVVERERAGAELCGEPFCMLERAIDDGRYRCAARAEVPGGQLAGPPRSDQHDATAVEAFEDLLREGGRRCRDGGGALADRRLETRATPGVQRHAEGPVEHRAGGSRLVGVPHLPEDLALAGDEGVEARCDAEEVQRGRLVRKPVCDRSERVRVRAREREERAVRDLARVAVARRDVELRPVAGGEDDRFGLAVAVPHELPRE